MYADLVLDNANVVTMNPAQPRAELVAVRGNRIMLVDKREALAQVRGPGTRVIDCQGKTVMPGFNDAHCHIFSFIRKQGELDLSPASVRSIAEIKEAVRRRAESLPPGRWVTGSGYNEFYLAERRHPNRWELDEAAPGHPVVLTHRSLHACVLNSRALSLAGITAESAEPPGAIIERDLTTGEPSGLLFEMVGYLRERVMPPLSPEELAEGVKLAGQHFLSLGITSLQDATITNDLSRWQTIRGFKDSGLLKSRVYLMFGLNALGQFREAGLNFGAGDSRLRLGGVKLMPSEAKGELQPPLLDLKEQALAAHRAGFPLAIHCFEPGTVEAAISVLEYLSRELPESLGRHRLEHCAECPPRSLERLSRLGVVVVTQPPFVYYSGERYLATIPAARRRWLYRIGSLIKSGLVVAGSSDSPVVPDNPLVGVYAAVTRRAESGQALSPREGITLKQALEMYTVNAAYASSEEQIKGSIAPGKVGDMVVLSADPLKPPLERLRDIRVEITVVDGRVEWEA